MTSLSKAYAILRSLYKVNHARCLVNPLHLLANMSSTDFDSEHKKLATYLLRKDSFLAPNVVQYDSNFLTPLTLAIKAQNSAFIELFFISDLVKLSSKFEMVIDLTDLSFC